MDDGAADVRMATYLLVYFVAVVVGVAASVLLDIQLRRPGLGKSVALGVLVVFLAVAFSVTDLPQTQWLLLLWAGIGLLAGLGSSDHARL